MSKDRGKSPSQRQLRVGEELRHALAEIIARGELRDPALINTPVTVTEVRASPDLRHATAYVVPLGGGDSEAVLAGLRRAAPYLQNRVARAVHLKFVPKFDFCADTSFDYAQKIDTLLHAPGAVAETEQEQGEDGGGA